MSKAEIARIIYDFITTDLNSSAAIDFDLELNLLESNVLDSTALVDLVLWLEETFVLQIDPEDLMPENFETLSAMANFVQEQSETVMAE